MTEPMYDLSIIIVSYNTAGLLGQCLDSIEKHMAGKMRFTAIVVDNDSRDGTRERLRAYQAAHAWVQTVLLDANVGFARANNIGIRHCSSRNVLLLNSDTYLIDDSLLEAVAYLDGRTDVFGCGCTLLDRDYKRDVSFGLFPTVSVVLREIFTNRFNRLRGVVPGEKEPFRSIDFPCGAFFLMKRNLLEKVGLLDERFFMYFEETDLAKRARDKGYAITYFGPTRVVHLRGGSSGPCEDSVTTLFYQSWNYYFRKHHTIVERILLNLVLFVYFSGMIAASALAGKKGTLHYYERHRTGLLRAWRRSKGPSGQFI
jgi:GT2 family glycosyltransferase